MPVALEGKVEAKLNEALSLDIIEPVLGPSKWISPVVIVFKGNGDIRLKGIYVDPEKVLLIQRFRRPENREETRSFL